GAERDHPIVPWIQLYLMHVTEREGDWLGAAALGRQVLARLEGVDAPYVRFVACLNNAIALYALGRHEESYASIEQGRACAERASTPAVQAYAFGHFAAFEHARGDLASAEAYHLRSIEDLAQDSAAWVRADSLYRHGMLLFEQRRDREALKAHRGAVEACSDMRRARLSRMWVAIVHATLGELAAAHAAHAVAIETAVPIGWEVDARLLDLLWRVVSGGDLAGVRAQLAEVTPRSPVHTTLLRVIGVELLRRDPDSRALHVSPEMRWVKPPGGPPAALGRRPVSRRLLAAFVEARLRYPGKALTEHDLIAAAWPGEAVVASTRQRLHANLHNLRGLGLREVIETVDDGWRLLPSLPVFYAVETP
ncbi:MAG: hypothetical protein KC620_18480, partial [Myxococcales bacterium]|nr:hypothetical protein [Myxococcales bacterium]